MERIHQVFVVNRRLPTKNDFLTDEEIDNYFRVIDETQKKTFSHSGHMLLCIFLKQMHHDDSIGDVLNSLSYFKKFTKGQKKHIKDTIESIFITESSRVQELSSQKGGGSLNLVFFFSILCFLMQTAYYSFYMEYMIHEIRQLDSEMKDVSKSMNTVLGKYADTSIEAIYKEMIPYSPDKTILKNVLTNFLYPQFFEPQVRNSDEFKNNTDMFVMYVTVLNDGFIKHIRDPTVEFTDMFSTIAINKQNKLLEKQYRDHVKGKIDTFKLLNNAHKEFIVDNEHYTDKEHKEVMKKTVEFENKLDAVLLKVSTPSNTLLKDDPEFKELIGSLEDIGDFMEKKKTKLNEALDNLSKSTEISFPSFSSINDDNTGGMNYNPNTQIGKKFMDALGITTIKKYEKYIQSQMTAVYNGYVHPYIEAFKQIGVTIKHVVKTLSVTATTIKDITIKLKDLNDNGALKDILETMPSKLSLIMQIYNRMKTILPGLLWYFGTIFTVLLSLFGEGFTKIISLTKRIGSRTRKNKPGRRIVFSRYNRTQPNSPTRSSNTRKSPRRSRFVEKEPTREENVSALLSKLTVQDRLNQMKNQQED